VRKSQDGLTVAIRRSKTDQEAEGYELGVPYGSNPATCPVRAFDAWLELAVITEGALFRSVDRHGKVQADRLSDRDVARVVKRRLEAAGIDPQRYSGHSLRAGFITSAAEAEVETWQIKKQSRHASDRVLHGYIRTATLFRHNAAAKVGLSPWTTPSGSHGSAVGRRAVAAPDSSPPAHQRLDRLRAAVAGAGEEGTPFIFMLTPGTVQVGCAI
jgi:Phage integrase family